eukprot:tig00000459_g1124.t1
MPEPREQLVSSVRQRAAAGAQKDQQIASLAIQLEKAVQEKEKALEAPKSAERAREQAVERWEETNKEMRRAVERQQKAEREAEKHKKAAIQAHEERSKALKDSHKAAKEAEMHKNAAMKALERLHKAEKETEAHKNAVNKEREDAIRNIKKAGAKFKKAVEERDAARAEAERLRAQLAEAERVVQETFEQQAQASSEGPKRQSAPAKKLQADLNAAQLARSKAEQAFAKVEEEKRAMACQIAEVEEDAYKREQAQKPLHEKLRAFRDRQ